MTGHQFKDLRRALGLTLVDYALDMGYVGYANNLKRLIRRYEERAGEDVPPRAAQRARKLALDRKVTVP